MTPSKACTIASRWSTASGFSTLASTGPAHALLGHDRVHQLDVLGRADERQRDQVDAEAEGEAQVLGVLVGQGGHADRHVRQRDALVVGDRAALGDQAADVVAGDVGDLDRDPAVVDQQPVARLRPPAAACV